MLPPLLMYLHVAKPNGRSMRMWLPLFLLWLILLPIVLLALVLTILVDIALGIAGQSYHYYTLLLLGLLGLAADLRGMQMHVHSEETAIDIDLM